MGDRYIISIKCTRCGHFDDDVYYAPTCGFTTWKCPECSTIVNLEDYTGISYEDCSNEDLIKNIIKGMDKK